MWRNSSHLIDHMSVSLMCKKTLDTTRRDKREGEEGPYLIIYRLRIDS